MKQIYKKEYSALFALLFTPSLFGMFGHFGRDINAIHSRMEVVFEELSERTQSRKIAAPDYSANVQEDDNAVIISIRLADNITSDAISVEVDDDVLDVVVQSKDRLEVSISGQRMNITAQQNLEHEAQDEHGHIYAVSSGSACMSQSRMLPARVDLTVAPKADLADGVLILTLAKKGPQKIAVTTSTKTQVTIPVDENVVEEQVVEKRGRIEPQVDELVDIEDLK